MKAAALLLAAVPAVLAGTKDGVDKVAGKVGLEVSAFTDAACTVNSTSLFANQFVPKTGCYPYAYGADSEVIGARNVMDGSVVTIEMFKTYECEGEVAHTFTFDGSGVCLPYPDNEGLFYTAEPTELKAEEQFIYRITDFDFKERLCASFAVSAGVYAVEGEFKGKDFTNFAKVGDCEIIKAADGDFSIEYDFAGVMNIFPNRTDCAKGFSKEDKAKEIGSAPDCYEFTLASGEKFAYVTDIYSKALYDSRPIIDGALGIMLAGVFGDVFLSIAIILAAIKIFKPTEEDEANAAAASAVVNPKYEL
mmetsp:Transcript_10245/g.14535  ORF Transcript_10245/g.14535 Transcript_10245/m.14535 type:complete len:306 (-) Transcript_10245:74-991(-)